MVTGKVDIVLSNKEPEFKDNLWMKPFTNKDGYELLYYGSSGWTPLIPRCPIHNESSGDTTFIDGPDRDPICECN